MGVAQPLIMTLRPYNTGKHWFHHERSASRDVNAHFVMLLYIRKLYRCLWMYHWSVNVKILIFSRLGMARKIEKYNSESSHLVPPSEVNISLITLGEIKLIPWNVFQQTPAVLQKLFQVLVSLILTPQFPVAHKPLNKGPVLILFKGQPVEGPVGQHGMCDGKRAAWEQVKGGGDVKRHPEVRVMTALSGEVAAGKALQLACRVWKAQTKSSH